MRGYLQLMAASGRVLGLVEIDILLSIADNYNRSERSKLIAEDEEVVKGSIQRALGPLVKFPHQTAQFVHSTVKDFFISLESQPSHDLHQTHGIRMVETHMFCARSCMAYLLHESIPEDVFNLARMVAASSEHDSHTSRSSSTEEVMPLVDLFDLEEVQFLRDKEHIDQDICFDIKEVYRAYDYAIFWTFHVARCQELLSDEDMKMVRQLLSLIRGRCSDWYKYSSHHEALQRPPEDHLSTLVLAAMFNFERILRLMVEEVESHPIPQEEFPRALFWAASRGNLSIVEILLKHGVPSAVPEARDIPLSIAVRGNYAEVCKCLLAPDDVDPNQTDSSEKPPLVLAAEADHVEIMKLLLAHHRIDVNFVGWDRRTALIAACQNSSVKSVQILREDGRANVNQKDKSEQTALHYASANGDLKILRTLLSFSNINVHVQDRAGRYPVSLAAQQGHLPALRFLVKHHSDTTAVDLTGRNSISWAANSPKATASSNNNEESTLEYLVRKWPHAADIPDEYGWTPLAWAVDDPGYAKAIRILSQVESVDINRLDMTSGRCVLSWAAASGMIEIMHILLRRPDLDPNAKSANGQTALASAAANGRLDAVRLLLRTPGVLIDLPGSKGRTPADWADLNHFDEIRDLLRSAATRQQNTGAHD